MFLIPLLASAQDDEILVDPLIPAQFPGGSKEFIKFIKTNLKYPTKALKNRIEGTVYVVCRIEKDGSINKDSVKVSKSIDPELDAEAIRIVKLSPNWTPAVMNEKNISQRMRVPVRFRIAKPTKKYKGY